MPQGLNVRSEIGTLRKVMLHRPGGELLNLSPDNLAPLLFDDIPFSRWHRRSTIVLHRCSATRV